MADGANAELLPKAEPLQSTKEGMDPKKGESDSPTHITETTQNPGKEVGTTKQRSRKLAWILGIAGLLVLVGVSSWYFKWYQPLLDQYNAASVTIKVKEGDTYAVEEAKISLHGKEYTTDSNGKVTVQGIVAGSYEVSTKKEGYVDGKSTISLHRGDNDPIYVSLVKVPPKVYVIKGFVQEYASGQPLVNVQVTLGTKTVQTDPSGAYTFEKVVPADIKVVLSKAGYHDKELSLKVSDVNITTLKIPMVPVGTVVFVSNRDGKRALYTSNYDGSDQKLFLAQKMNGEQYAPVFSPDGRHLLFVSTEDGAKGSYGQPLVKLYMANQDGKGVKKVSEDVGLDFAPIWSPSSSYVYFSGYASAKMDQATYRVYDTAKGAVIDIGETAYSLTFSLDGQKVVFYVNGQEDRTTTSTPAPDGSTTSTTAKVYLNILKTLDLVSGTKIVVAKKEQGMTGISFDVLSKSVYYETVQEGVRHRYQVSIGGTDEQEIALNDQPISRTYIPSPDGTLRAFIEERDGKRDVFIVAKDGTGEKRVTNLGVIVENPVPVWTTSGRAIVCAIKREGETALYLVSLDGGDPKKITDYYSAETGGIN